MPVDAAFCSAERTTLVGSITPAVTRSSYCSVCALKPFFVLHVLHALHDNRALVPGVDRDPPHRFLDGPGDDGDADLLSPSSFSV